MNIKYDAEADILTFLLNDTSPANAISERGGVIISYDDTDKPVSVEFLDVSKRQLINSQSLMLLKIAGLGSSGQQDISERDEEILRDEIDPIHGWSSKRDGVADFGYETNRLYSC